MLALGEIVRWGADRRDDGGRLAGAGDLDVGARVVTRRLTSTPDQVARARHIVESVIGREHPCRDDVLLLTSEVATNALRHSQSGAVEGEFALTVTCTASWARVEVRDDGSEDFPRALQPGTDAIGGRGVMLVDRLAARWGFVCDDRGTVVWFESGSNDEAQAATLAHV